MNDRRAPSNREIAAVSPRATDGERIRSPKLPRILLVDDSPAILSFIKAYLVRTACEFVEAHDAHRAIRLTNLTPFDLIIADVNMPGMSGIEMVAALRSGDHPDSQTVPIILMTGDKSPDLERRARDSGTTEFLVKPIDGTLLTSTVARLLRKGV